MKKIYLLTMLILSTLSFGQATDLYFSKYGEGSSNNKFLEIYNGTGAQVDLSNYSVELYANGGTTATNTQTFAAGTILNAGDVYVLRNSGAALAAIIAAADITSGTCNFNGDDAVVLKKNTDVIDMIGQVGVDPGASWPVAGITGGTVDHTLVRKTTVCSPNPTPLGSFGTDAATSEWTVEASDYVAGLGSFNGCNTAPNISITSPSNGVTLSPETTSVNVILSVSNFNVAAAGAGDGYIKYSINGGTASDKFDTTDIIVPTTPGTYTVIAELVDNSGNPLSPAKSATVSFTVAAYIVASDLAAVRADVLATTVGKYYQISSTPVITYARPTNVTTYRKQKYVQDASAGILIDDNTPETTNPTLSGMVIGDAISGLKGQTTNYNGVLQFVPIVDATVASSGNVITPEVVTVPTLKTGWENYESELVLVKQLTFQANAQGTPFQAGTNYDVAQPDLENMIFRTLFAEADYINQNIPSTPYDIVLLVAEFNNTPQVVARSLADITLSNNKFDNIAGLQVYPNPAKTNLFVTSNSFAEKQVVLYDVLGKVALKAKVTNQPISVTSLPKGVYIAKITEEGKTATRKVVIE
ncbi:T9SS type A sorting domain-containing protein [Flavobacterium luminosum]|uniref:T9SS type A sorting domain-containing protein n=1 Tax=Flavobacterium luminosum TaxID=2949086 RepID=A0ABT0TPZ1_9FLAO|nr:T9SS type A sorting domain-containing protein [Flavobacterium sp. HXWNR70]MCL9809555.1 T9SS type A sorting domain-containing protein [Flavobacterium sp. HXWNR70]